MDAVKILGMNRARRKTKMILAGLIALRVFLMPVSAEEVINCWDEKKKAHYERRMLSTAINIYAKNGTVPRVLHKSGIWNLVEYDVLEIDPDENTFLKVDYSETPVYLSELYDRDLIAKGYQRAGGINAGYFSNTNKEYGRPTGAVRVKNEWTTWNGHLNTPAYGSGFATVYFNTYDMELRYHGWKNSKWMGDDCWNWWTGYLIDAENAVSGSYTWFADGKEQDITGGDTGMLNYHTYGRALTIFAQNSDGRFLLIEFYGTGPEEKVRKFLRLRNVTDAIRLDGGGSCQMIYEEDLVNQPFSEAVKQPQDPPLFMKDAMKKRWEKR